MNSSSGFADLLDDIARMLREHDGDQSVDRDRFENPLGRSNAVGESSNCIRSRARHRQNSTYTPLAINEVTSTGCPFRIGSSDITHNDSDVIRRMNIRRDWSAISPASLFFPVAARFTYDPAKTFPTEAYVNFYNAISIISMVDPTTLFPEPTGPAEAAAYDELRIMLENRRRRTARTLGRVRQASQEALVNEHSDNTIDHDGSDDDDFDSYNAIQNLLDSHGPNGFPSL